MGTDIRGYVEINTRIESGEDLWFVVIELVPIVERDYTLFGALFGVRGTPWEPGVTYSRHLPSNTADPARFRPHDREEVGHGWVDGEDLHRLEDRLWALALGPGWQFVLRAILNRPAFQGGELL